MEPVIASVVAVLSGYLLDTGKALLEEGGNAAVEAARRLLDTVMQRLKADPREVRDAERFEHDPKGYEAPVRDALTAAVAQDPSFAQQLRELLAMIEAAAPGTTQIIVSGSGAAASDHSVAAGAGGAAAGAGGTAYVGGTPPPPSQPTPPGPRSEEAG